MMEVLKLVKKDLRVYRFSIVLSCLFSFFFGFLIVLSRDITTMYVIYTAHALFLCFFAFFGTMENNIKNDRLFISLPVKRKNIVISKYITYILISLFLNLLYYLQVLYFINASNWNTPYMPFANVSFNLALVSLEVGIILASIIHFSYYLIGYRKNNRSNLVLYIFLIFDVGTLLIFTRSNFRAVSLDSILTNENLTLIALGILLVGLVLYLASMKVSIILYEKTEV